MGMVLILVGMVFVKCVCHASGHGTLCDILSHGIALNSFKVDLLGRFDMCRSHADFDGFADSVYLVDVFE
jgi:hypothetical protein